MPLNIGPGVEQWIKDHQATPRSHEQYMGPDYVESVTLVELADSQGQPVENAVVYNKGDGSIRNFEPA
jgi:hypothetical protein